jgi:hypothetical protein
MRAITLFNTWLGCNLGSISAPNHAAITPIRTVSKTNPIVSLQVVERERSSGGSYSTQCHMTDILYYLAIGKRLGTMVHGGPKAK